MDDGDEVGAGDVVESFVGSVVDGDSYDDDEGADASADRAELSAGSQKFDRGAPLPTRVRDGAFEDDHLVVGGESIPWSEVTFLALGIIDQMVKDSELKKGPLRQMMQKVVGGEDSNSPKDRARQVREVYLLDVFTERQEKPFRFDSGNVHYKTFLDKVGYVSHHNFFRFCVHLCRHIPHARVTASLAFFLAKRRDKVAHFEGFHDYELETDQQLRFERDIVNLSEVDLSKDSWMEEWTDDE